MENKVYRGLVVCILAAILMLLSPSCPVSADDDSEKAVLIMQTGVSLMQQKKYSAAADKFLHLLEFGHLYGKEFAGIQRTFLISDVENLVKVYPDCRGKVLKTYRSLLEKARNFTIHPNELGVLTETATMLGVKNELLAVYHAMRKADPDHEMLTLITDEVFPLLYQSRHYALIVRYLDLVKRAGKEMDIYRNLESEMLRGYARDRLQEQFTRYAAIYSSLGRKENLRRINRILDALIIEAD